MPKTDDEYQANLHPPYCTCPDCTARRLAGTIPTVCFNCTERSLFFDKHVDLWKCLICKRTYTEAEVESHLLSLSTCPNCKEKSLFLDKSIGFWKCLNCRNIYPSSKSSTCSGSPGAYKAKLKKRTGIVITAISLLICGIFIFWLTNGFTTDTESPAVPIIVSPENKMTTNGHIIALEWGKVDDPSGVKYEVQVDNDATFTSPEFVNNKLKYCSVKTGYLEDDIYYWRVRAADGADNVGLWSDVRCFWCYTQPPYAKTFGQQVNLINNWDASDPTWQQLLSFLLIDKTDNKDYSLFSFPCGAFAEEVHNNAEAAGIRAAWVAVDFEDNSDGHALNAFITTDKGLVYVDCTSSYRSDIKYPPVLNVGTGQVIEWKPESLPSHDKIAYAAIDREYGQITLDKATSPEYAFYTAYMQRFNEYKQDVNAYNARAEAYMRLLGGRVVIYDPVEYARLKTMHDDLENERVRLESIRGTLGEYGWEPLGIVENIKIYW